MSHSLIGADRRTHCKIVLVALVGAATLVGAAGTALQSSDHAAAKVTVIKAGKPVAVAHSGAVIR
jgi:hypothetical protein